MNTRHMCKPCYFIPTAFVTFIFFAHFLKSLFNYKSHYRFINQFQDDDGTKEQSQQQPTATAAQVKQRKKGSSKSGTRRERVVGKFGRSYKRAEVTCQS